MILYKIDIDAVARSLNQPFVMQHVAQVDHFAAYLYLCEGMVARHQHAAQDELFYVYRGRLELSTDWGQQSLREHEFAVVPHGLGHTSASVTPTVVMLLQAEGEPERKNGHGRLVVDPSSGPLPKWSVRAEAKRLREPFLPEPLVRVDEMSWRLVWCEGETAWHAHDDHDELLFVVEGKLDLGTELGPLSLVANELIVIPRRRIHRLTSRQRTILLSLIHSRVPAEAHMGR